MKQQNKEKQEIAVSKELEDYKSKVNEYTNDLKRLQADFENYKKRSEKESALFTQYSNAKLISKFLVILDDFDSCIKNMHHSDEHTKGMTMLHSKIYKILHEEGLQEIEAKGVFDPYKHEVMTSCESQRPDGEIVEVIQKGYMLKGKVLRHAKVMISK